MIHIRGDDHGDLSRFTPAAMPGEDGWTGEDTLIITGDAVWFPEEVPSPEEYRRAIDNLEACGRRVDYIVTHTAPPEHHSQSHSCNAGPP